MPDDLMEVASRQKDIQYSSRTRAITNHMLQMQKMRQALQTVMQRIPRGGMQDPEIKAIAELACHRAYNIVHLIYQSKRYEGHSKDYEFSGWMRCASTGRAASTTSAALSPIRAGWIARHRTSASSPMTSIAGNDPASVFIPTSHKDHHPC